MIEHRRILLGQRLTRLKLSRIPIIFLAIGTIAFVSPSVSPSVHAAGLLYVLPISQPLQPVGSTFSVKVQVAGIDPFNGWEIQIQSDPSVINATSLSIDGNVLAANDSLTVVQFENCINGNGCHGPGDGMGVVHSAAAALGNTLPTSPSDGLLFTITYRVVGLGTYSPIHILSELITNGPNSTVTVQTQDGTYGIPPGQGFTLAFSPESASFVVGSNANIIIAVSSFGGYSGVVNLTLGVSQSGLVPSLNATSVSLLSNQPSFVKLTIASDRNYPQASHYTVSVTAVSNGFPQSKTLSVTTLPKPDFILDTSPSVLKIHAGDSGSSKVTLDTQSGFSGSINLKLDAPSIPGLISSMGDTNLTISPGQPAATLFSVRTPPSDVAFVYLFNITASSGSSTHARQIRVQSPSPNFNFQVGASGFVVQAGQSRVFTLNATSVDYFKGNLYLLASSLSGIKETFSRSSVALDFGNSSTSLMTITTDVYLSPGNHYLNVTALGTTFLGVPVNHSIIITVTVISVSVTRTILGLPPPAYFGIVGALWLGLVGVAIREIRKPKPKRFLT